MSITIQLEELEKIKKEHDDFVSKNKDLQKEQCEFLKELIEHYKPAMDWYKHKFVFTHPTIAYRTSRGPILGFRDTGREDILIIYSVSNNQVEYVDLDDEDNVKRNSLWNVVEDGYFKDAVKGIRYLDIMLKDYLERVKGAHKNLSEELESARGFSDN
ncbi:hypothetical protein [Halobacillus seohaensis]|uniref:Uncharacterized protein n=1 Tax=Halobacillus seohaensis TaxID=447421 RepID=A0ABW2EIL3_9BACI